MRSMIWNTGGVPKPEERRGHRQINTTFSKEFCQYRLSLTMATRRKSGETVQQGDDGGIDRRIPVDFPQNGAR